jgi:predicted PurR-regulated permease PerM
LLWGALVVVGVSDYAIRPRLVGDDSMPALLVFIALFGSLEVLGLSGLIMGPVLVSARHGDPAPLHTGVNSRAAGNA